MAYSATIVTKTVFGDKRVVVLSCVADAASGNVSAGLGTVVWAEMSPVSMATAAPRVKINSLEAGTASAGFVGFSGCVSGDVFYLACYGR